MIAGHSNGQPSRKMRTSTMISISTGENGSASMVSVIQFAVPRRANTAPKMFEVTARNSTMLEVAVVLSTARFSPAQVNLPVGEGEHARAERADRARLGRGREPAEHRAEHRADQHQQRHHADRAPR